PVFENLPDLVADRVVDALDVELGRERGLDAVDDRELGVPLFGFLEQVLRFIKQTGVLERRTQRGGDGRQQAKFRLAVSVLALEVFEIDDPEYAVAADNRYQDHGLALIRAWDGNCTGSRVVRGSVVSAGPARPGPCLEV